MTLTEHLLRRLPITGPLYTALDAANAEIAKLSDPEMKDLRIANGNINLEIAGKIVERLALALTSWFREGGGAGNYVEMHINARDAPYEGYAVTVQRRDRKSPHQLRMEAEAEVRELRRQIERTENTLYTVIAQLRHAYTHLYAERVLKQRELATGLLGPQIEQLERVSGAAARGESSNDSYTPI